ncbi:MAG: hypothetical protein EOP07_21075 [Proteobacteria bacterium]|nr:MAG: hypothetical protein EOP07_21075 [Pseudomonadota bacterium]
MKRKIAALVGILSFSAIAPAADLVSLRQAEKISLTLTAKPLSPELRKSFLAGQITLEALADKLSTDPDFIENFAMFYTRTMGFQLPFHAYELRDAAENESFGSITSQQYPEGYNAEYAKNYDKEHMERNAIAMRGPLQVKLKDCPEGPVLHFSANPVSIESVKKAAATGIGPDGRAVLEGTLPFWKEILPIYERGDLPCGSNFVDVKPWWDPVQVSVDSKYRGLTSYKATPLVVEHCGGSDLKLCNTTSLGDKDRFTDLFNRDLMLEPGYYIAHTVAEDRPFTEIVTGTDTIMTGTYGTWMTFNGPRLWANYPGGSIDDANHPIFKTPNAADRKHYRIKRNALHAGVLTSPAYQLLTNGRRAKANKAYETFLCSKFGVPATAKPDPTDSNPDLTQRAYCSFCHKSLEPMAAFFNNWPLTGEPNYLYDNKTNPDSRGRFAGVDGKGAAGFGKIMSETEAFAECTTKRAFEFVNGRKMSAAEIEKQLPTYVALLRSSKMSLRAVIKAMLADPQFLKPTKE